MTISRLRIADPGILYHVEGRGAWILYHQQYNLPHKRGRKRLQLDDQGTTAYYSLKAQFVPSLPWHFAAIAAADHYRISRVASKF